MKNNIFIDYIKYIVTIILLLTVATGKLKFKDSPHYMSFTQGWFRPAKPTKLGGERHQGLLRCIDKETALRVYWGGRVKKKKVVVVD